MKLLSVGSIIKQHTRLIAQTGGADGVRDMNLLDSAVSSTYQSAFGQDLYPTVYDKAAHLAYSLIKNHPFVDGNKRIGVLVMIAFLETNGIDLYCSNEELIAFGLAVADSTLAFPAIKDWILQHT